MREHYKKILITGGAGFIGSHVVRFFVQKYPQYLIYNLDKLTYAGNLENVADVENASNYRFIEADVADLKFVDRLFSQEHFDGVIHLAAASHVDRSLEDPLEFVNSNVAGTVSLLKAATNLWGTQNEQKCFYHISTDEVYGTLGLEGVFTEQSPLTPRSPYSASKAASDHFVDAFRHSYGLPTLISRCVNNYGPNQFPEKLIPLAISRLLAREPIPVYGQGDNVRDWLYVTDHAAAIDQIFHRGTIGSVYNIGGGIECRNMDLILLLCDLFDSATGQPEGLSRKLITLVEDRPGHDFRYAVDSSRLVSELGWQPKTLLKQGLGKTLSWYLSNTQWLERVQSGAYRSRRPAKVYTSSRTEGI